MTRNNLVLVVDSVSRFPSDNVDLAEVIVRWRVCRLSGNVNQVQCVCVCVCMYVYVCVCLKVTPESLISSVFHVLSGKTLSSGDDQRMFLV